MVPVRWLWDRLILIRFESEGMLSMFPVNPFPERDRRKRFSFKSVQIQEGMLPSNTEFRTTVVHGIEIEPGQLEAAPNPSNERMTNEEAEQIVEGRVPWKQFLVKERIWREEMRKSSAGIVFEKKLSLMSRLRRER
jgi:hypothetical protein